MNRRNKLLSLAGIGLATWMTATAATADERAMEKKTSTSATVEKVDAAKRDLSLKDDQGNRFMVQVPEDVTRFDAIKKGDRVNVDYYESAALSLKKPGEATSPSATTTTMAQRAPGNLPGGMVSRKIVATANVMKVDLADNKVTIQGPHGSIDTIKVSDPAVQDELSKLKAGDRIQASYTEALAISVTPKDKSIMPKSDQ